MKRCMLLAVCLAVVMGGCQRKLVVADLDKFIVDAAAKAKAANADKLELQVAYLGAFKAGATAPIPVVPISLSGTLQKTTSVKVTVDLGDWTGPIGPLVYPPSESGYYVLDPEDNTLSPIPATKP